MLSPQRLVIGLVLAFVQIAPLTGLLMVVLALTSGGVCHADEFATFHSTGAAGGRADWIYPAEEQRRVEAVHDVITPHIPLANPLAGGPVRILAIANRNLGRWPLEIAQRLEADLTVVYADTETQLGAQAGGSVAQQRIDIEARLLAAMNASPDIIISDVKYAAYGEKVQQRLHELIAGGVSYLGHLEGIALDDFNRDADVVERIFMRAAAFEGLRALQAAFESRAAAAGGAISLYQRPGAGCLVEIWTWPRDEQAPDPSWLMFEDLPRMERESWYAVLAQLILYCTGRIESTANEAAVFLPRIDRRQMPLMPTGLPFPVAQGGSVELQVWDASGRQVHSAVAVARDGLAIAPLPAGDYFVLLRYLDMNGAIADFRWSHLQVTAETQISDIELTSRYLEADEMVEATVQLSAAPASGSTLQVETIDNFGRVVFRESMPATVSAKVSAATAGSLHLYNYLNVNLLDARGDVISEERLCFIINQPPIPTNELTVKMWTSGSNNPRIEHLNWKHAQDGVEAGLIGAHRGSTDTNSIETLARMNIRASLWKISVRGPSVSPEGIRSPDLSSPSFIRSSGNTLRNQAEVFRHYSPYSYSLGDDQSFLSPGMDAGWSESNRASLAAWVKQRYGSVAELNAAWGTEYQDFDEVAPIRLADAVALALAAEPADYGALARWIDHQFHQEEMVARWHGLMREEMRQADPQTRVGMCNTIHYPHPNTGFDYWLLAETMDESGAYPHRMTHDIYRSARGPEKVHGAYSGGYGVYKRIPYYAMELYPWWAVFSNLNALFYWHGSTAGVWNYGRVIAQDLGPVYGYRNALDNIQELKSGVARMLYDAQRDNDGIKVLYSPGSINASAFIMPLPRGAEPTNLGMAMLGETDPASLIPPLPKPEGWERSWAGADMFVGMQSWEGITHLLNDIGFSYDALSTRVLSAETLDPTQVRMLVLPLTLRLTEHEAQLIRDFVRAGGVVMADLGAGVFNENMRPAAPGVLADVFGVSYRGDMPHRRFALEEVTVAASTWQARDLPLPERESLERWMVYQGLELDGAVALAGSAGGAPVLTINNYGKGQAIMFNALARDYTLWRTLAREMPFRQAVAAMLESAGLAPVVTAQVFHSGGGVGFRPLQATQVVRFHEGDAIFVGLLRDFAQRWDESVFMSDLRPHVADIDLGREAHVYDVRTGTYRGYRRKIDVTVYPAKAMLFALLPYEVIRMDGRVDYRPDRAALQLAASLVTQGQAAPGRHTFRLEITDPTGKARREYAANVAAPGAAYSSEVFLGYDPEPGRWQVSIKDVASGVRLVREVEVP